MVTVGLGDIVPLNTGSRIFSIPYDTVGILSFAIVVAFLRSTVLESLQDSYVSSAFRTTTRLAHPPHLSTVRYKEYESHILRHLRGTLGNRRMSLTSEEKSLHEQSYEQAVEALARKRRKDFRSEVRAGDFLEHVTATD